jgi:hypothetical protein
MENSKPSVPSVFRIFFQMCAPFVLLSLIIMLTQAISFAASSVDIQKSWPENNKTYSDPSPCEGRDFEVKGPGIVRLGMEVNPHVEDLSRGNYAGDIWYFDTPWANNTSYFDKTIKREYVQDGKLLDSASKLVNGRPYRMEIFYRMDQDKIYKGKVWLCPPYKTSLAGQFLYQWRQSARLTLASQASGQTKTTGGGIGTSGGATTVEGKAKGSIVNLALKKPARQSSVYGGTGVDQGPHFGVDGIRESVPRDPFLLVHTNADNPPWWQVDLQNVYALTQLSLYNRIFCCGEKNRTIQVYLSSNGSNWEKAYQHDGSNFKVLTVNLQGRNAKFVRLQLAESTFLHFQECEVYGYLDSPR